MVEHERVGRFLGGVAPYGEGLTVEVDFADRITGRSLAVVHEPDHDLDIPVIQPDIIGDLPVAFLWKPERQQQAPGTEHEDRASESQRLRGEWLAYPGR